MKISRHQILSFAAVGRERSFTGAARSLGLSQSAITQHISALEAQIGTRLFIRSRSGTELTRSARELFNIADQMHVLDNLFEERATQFADMDTGSLTVCVSTPRPAMAIITEFKRCYPGIELALEVAPWRESIAKIRERSVDVAVVAEPDNLQGLHYEEVERRPFVAIVPRDHRFSRRKRISVQDLQDETLVMLSDSSYTRYWVERRFRELGFSPKRALTTSTYEMTIEAVIHHMGVSIILDNAVSRMDSVHRLKIQEFDQEHAYFAVCPQDKAPLRAVKTFLEVARNGRCDGPWRAR